MFAKNRLALDGLRHALAFRLYAPLNRHETVIDGNTLTYRVKTCRVQDARAHGDGVSSVQAGRACGIYELRTRDRSAHHNGGCELLSRCDRREEPVCLELYVKRINKGDGGCEIGA